MPELLFKVLLQGKSCHGGNLKWSLPKKKNGDTQTPGDWHEISGALSLCKNGFHLTDAPAEWWMEGCTVYVAETEGESLKDGNKSCHQKVRLLREATDAELEAKNIFFTGSHEVKEGKAIASGSSRVIAWGSSRVEARDSSRVIAWGSSRVEARGSSRVVARDSSRVIAWGSSRVEARDSSRVVARDSSRVEAWDSSRVEAWDSSRVEASGSSTTNDYTGKAQQLSGYAVLIDRSKSPPVIVGAWQ